MPPSTLVLHWNERLNGPSANRTVIVLWRGLNLLAALEADAHVTARHDDRVGSFR